MSVLLNASNKTQSYPKTTHAIIIEINSLLLWNKNNINERKELPRRISSIRVLAVTQTTLYPCTVRLSPKNAVNDWPADLVVRNPDC